MAKRYLGLDIGRKHIGTAVGDDEVRIASPLPVVINDDGAMGNLVGLIKDSSIDVVVAGRPRSTKGVLTRQTDYSEGFLRDLRQALDEADLNVSIVEQDESLTSVVAEKRLRSSKHFNENMLKNGTLDSEAASIILADYLESLR